MPRVGTQSTYYVQRRYWPQGAVRTKPGLVSAFGGTEFPRACWGDPNLAESQGRLPGGGDIGISLEEGLCKSQPSSGRKTGKSGLCVRELPRQEGAGPPERLRGDQAHSPGLTEYGVLKLSVFIYFFGMHGLSRDRCLQNYSEESGLLQPVTE